MNCLSFIFFDLILECYGMQFSVDELLVFDVLKYDYEVDWYLKNLRKKISLILEELKLRFVVVRNRRLVYLNKFVLEGQYFFEDVMRDREFYLYYEYVGKFQDSMGRNMVRFGECWLEMLMRRVEEVVLVFRIREEQQRLGVVECDWVGNEKMEELEEELE